MILWNKNMCFFVYLFHIFILFIYCSHYLGATAQTYTTSTIIITTIAIRSLFLYAYNLFASQNFTLFCTQLTRNRNTRLINYNCLTSALLITFIYTHLKNVLNVEGSWSRLLENSVAKDSVLSYLSAPHACCYWFIWKVLDIFVTVYAYVYLTLLLLVVCS